MPNSFLSNQSTICKCNSPWGKPTSCCFHFAGRYSIKTGGSLGCGFGGRASRELSFGQFREFRGFQPGFGAKARLAGYIGDGGGNLTRIVQRGKENILRGYTGGIEVRDTGTK